MPSKKYDFSGWATVNDLLCADGRTIRRDAFKDDDGKVVPLVWNHNHTSVDNVLGKALLHNEENGVKAYCSFNDTPAGRNAKLVVEHGDVAGLSIYANKLKQIGGDVMHGVIREVSLVLATANPGALIDPILVHGDETDDQAIRKKSPAWKKKSVSRKSRTASRPILQTPLSRFTVWTCAVSTIWKTTR